MKRTFLLLLAVCLSAVSTVAQIDRENWMAGLSDDLFLARLSIPGAHDACTSGLSGASKTQTKSLAEQLGCGVRMFDLRPRWDGNTMYIYHGLAKTSVTFNDAMNTMCTFLDNHPQEFLFVIMRHEEDGASESQKKAWPDKMYESLHARQKYIVDYSPSLTVKDMRGKILVMSRNEYTNGPIGAYLHGGGDNSVYDRTIVGKSGAKMNITTQDMYNVAGDGQLENKVKEIKNMLDRSTKEAEYRLFMNHASGYSKTFFGISLESGVQECAKTCNAAIVDYMNERKGSMGFIMMDFAGDDSYQGQKLIDLIIQNNYDTFSSERDELGRTVRGGHVFVLPMGADAAWEARYVRKDAASATPQAVDAIAQPAQGWQMTDFDDSSWATMKMPLGSPGYDAPYRTTWNGEYNCYWMRRTFTLDRVNATSKYTLMIYHDDDYKVYVNGRMMLSADGWTEPGKPVTKEINKRFLNAGKNVVAICNQQNHGGAYSDCGIYETVNMYPDGIETVTDANDHTPQTYNMQGMAVNPRTKGIYISNGKKVIMK